MKNFLPKRYRKNKKTKYESIPEGMYCYEFDGTKEEVWNKKHKTYLTYYGVKSCPFYTHKNGKAYCKHLHSSGGLLFDQVKECGLNCNYE